MKGKCVISLADFSARVFFYFLYLCRQEIIWYAEIFVFHVPDWEPNMYEYEQCVIHFI